MRIEKPMLCLLSMLFTLGLFAQGKYKNDSADELNTFYNQHIGKAAILYSGPAYISLKFPMEGSPFLGGDSLTSSWIRYDGQYYKEILLQWDVLQNYVLTQALESNAKMILRTDLIDSFSLAGRLVKFIPADIKNNLMNEGLYDILYAGATTLMARRKKVVKERMENKTLVYEMSEKDSYYIRKKGIYYQVSNKNDLTFLFRKDLPEIKKEMRQNKLKWKKNFEQVLMIAVAHYDKAETIK